ncbi:hypothetical protein HII17_15220 [Thalassotalea sp. M1531]|uniref:Uncharacterized protein n=1 Tax=Thalassotalea algicola TaxID=2716224 RepID=A0A7Y0LEZ2_9GAMM|nr:hypothetical protein [Thalassotalea algicola]NMP32907.1 hypothetical protein [Thalassotalea algicola]
MLLFNGTAECQRSNKWFKRGNRHEFYMFSKNKDLMSQLDQIEQYFTERGLDHIEIVGTETLQDANEITNDMLMYAYDEASQKGLAGAIVRAPMQAA